jgi:hypothetical protein
LKIDLELNQIQHFPTNRPDLNNHTFGKASSDIHSFSFESPEETYGTGKYLQAMPSEEEEVEEGNH